MSKSDKALLCANDSNPLGFEPEAKAELEVEAKFEAESEDTAAEPAPVSEDGGGQSNATPDGGAGVIDGSYTELAYVHDGTLEGLLSAVFAAYANHERPTDIAPERMLQLRLDQLVRNIPANTSHAERVRRGICRACGPRAFETVKEASLSDDPETGMIIYTFIRHAMSEYGPQNGLRRTAGNSNRANAEIGKTSAGKAARLSGKACRSCARKPYCTGICTQTRKNTLSDIAHPAVGPLVRLARAVGNERHRMMQFLRFEHMEGDVWFARCNPNANVVPLLMNWFSGRFNTQAFIIYDETHNIAGVYNGTDWQLVKTDQITLPAHAADEQTAQRAWKRFYHTVAVESRYNPELRRQFMPKRLWKNIVEMQEGDRFQTFAQSQYAATSSTSGKTRAKTNEEEVAQLPKITRPSPRSPRP